MKWGNSMPRDYNPKEAAKRTAARRMHALARLDLREPTSPRKSAVGPTSHAVKFLDPASEKAIQDFLDDNRKVLR